jgi:hypothetical protein
MKLLAVENSSLTVLFQATKPSGQLYLPVAAATLTERYKFSGVPRSYQELSGERIDFKHGEFQGSALETLEIYSDGIVLKSRSNTDFLDAFFDDFCKFLANDLGLSLIRTHSIHRLYESILLVEVDPDVALKPLQQIAELGRMIEGFLKENSGLEVSYEPFGWSLATDQTRIPALKPSVFKIERRLGADYSTNQFVTGAPLKTDQHLKLLERLEKLF